MKTFSWVLATFIFSSLALSAQAQTNPSTVEKLDEYLQAVANLHRLNGTVLIAKKGEVLIQKGYGWRNEAAKIANDTSSIYQLGSITKTFTGAAILQLQAEGKLSVKDKLSKYFPDFPNADQITLDDLFAHTSGIYDYKGFLYQKEGPDKMDFTRPIDKNRLVARFSSKPTTGKPGDEVQYTNSGYYLLGLLIEKLTGKQFETVIRERFLTPLRLTNTGFDFINLKRPGKTVGYTYHKDSVLVAETPIDSTTGYAAGGMYSTVGDLYRWARAIQSSQFLSAADWQRSVTPIGKTMWSYGWGINKFKGNKVLAFQNGNLPGYSTFFTLMPEEDIVFVVLANVDDTSDLTTLEPILRDLVFIMFGEPYQLPKNHKSITLDESVLRQYVGNYQLEPKRILSITFDKGKLFLQVTGQGKFEIFPETETDFFLKAVDAQLTFHKQATGNVSQVVVHQNGDFVAKRIDP
ncbi:serine hydrolase [Spirosoma sp. BT702]|uniref:Serine hydrolase n=1 Tax=Spirosoma profusum TaxID=2771354 RepID=A0A926XUT9_9BACT|nr:serine hydrolase [Spirosoma profusum]MBD2700021.1 serine hydrolase [Spirosoma profusum]